MTDSNDDADGMNTLGADGGRGLRGVALAGLGLLVGLVLLVMFFWDEEPGLFDVRAAAREHVTSNDDAAITGVVTTATLIQAAETLLDKRGGYLSNDRLPPGVLMDNIPNWEFGVLTQVRDLAKALRNDFSRSQTQSTEDLDLSDAEPRFNFDNSRWILPSSESEYRKGIEGLQRYLDRLVDDNHDDAQFYARADNLADWLAIVEKRLGSLSQRLSASVGQVRVNTDLGGEVQGDQSKPRAGQVEVKTSWTKLDDEFYEARGATWALIQFLRAIEIDCRSVLEKKNALVSLQQIIRELESTQDAVWSPVILNGTGFGFVANHSLVMASFISRANAAVIDLRSLLSNG
ncbi:MAG: DUF2333 family protein [Gammaproteobacteria bacterium]|nr:DUF2333 family protein [Gammaproteobacteria bacterium]